MGVGLKVPSLVQGKNTFSKWQKLVPPKVTFTSTAVPTYAFLHCSSFWFGLFAFPSNQTILGCRNIKGERYGEGTGADSKSGALEGGHEVF